MKTFLRIVTAIGILFAAASVEAQVGCQNYYNGATLLGCFHNWKADGTSITCTQSAGTVTCSATGAIGGTIAATQIAFGSAANTIAGSNNLTWDNTNQLVEINGALIEDQSSTAVSAASKGNLRFNTSNHWDASENGGNYFQIILAQTTSDITWNAAAHSLSMLAAATDTAGNNFSITPGSAGTVSAAGGKAPGVLQLNGVAGVAGTAGQAAGTGGSVTITAGSAGANNGGGGANSGAINLTLGTPSGAGLAGDLNITGITTSGLGPVIVIGGSTTNNGPGVTLDAATNNGGRKYTVSSAGSSSGCGTGNFCIADNTAAVFRWGMDSVGNWQNFGANGAGASLEVNTTQSNPPASLYVIGGNIQLNTLPTPGQPTLTVNGTPGATTCSYYLIYLDRYGNRTLPGTPRTVNNCAATLNGVNSVTVQVPASANKSAYQAQIIRSAGGPSQGLIATVNGNITTNTVDTGLASSANTDPTYNATGDLVLSGANANGSVLAARVVSVGSTPSNTPGTGAGTGPTVTVTGDDMAGALSVLTGTGPSASATVVTITFNAPYTAAPAGVCLQSSNTAAAALTGNAQVFVSSLTQNTWVLTVGSTNLAATTTYTWTYHVIW